MKQPYNDNAAISTVSSKVLQRGRIYALIAIGVSSQIILSRVMENLHCLQNASDFQKSTLETHQIVGLIPLFFMIIPWLWILNKSSDVNINTFFSWFGKTFQQHEDSLLHLIEEKGFPSLDLSVRTSNSSSMA